MTRFGNIFAEVPVRLMEERIEEILSASGVRIERIVSTGQASADGFWYDQPWDEWVIVLSGAAGLQIEGEPEPRVLVPGDWLHLPAGLRHRVEWTDEARPTVWLAVHFSSRRARP